MPREMELDDLIKLLGMHAHETLIEHNQPSLMPLYHVHGDEVLVIGCPWTNEDEKLETLDIIKQKAKEINATMVGFVCEAWMTKHDNPNIDMSSIPPPSQSPNRIEVVMAFATDGDTIKSKSWQIMRNEANGILCLLPMNKPDGISSGRMIDDILPRKSKRHN